MQSGRHGLVDMFQDVEYGFGGEVRYLSATRVREHSSRTGNGSILSFSLYIDPLLRLNIRTSVSLHIHQKKAFSTLTLAPQLDPTQPSIDQVSTTHVLLPPKTSTRYPNLKHFTRSNRKRKPTTTLAFFTVSHGPADWVQ